MAKKIPIPKPPGGELSCSNKQMGVVRVKNGEVFATCYDPPLVGTSKDDPLEMLNWAMETITEQKRDPFDSIGRKDIKVLMSGEYEETDRYGELVLRVRFRLPETYRSTAKHFAKRKF